MTTRWASRSSSSFLSSAAASTRVVGRREGLLWRALSSSTSSSRYFQQSRGGPSYCLMMKKASGRSLAAAWASSSTSSSLGATRTQPQRPGSTPARPLSTGPSTTEPTALPLTAEQERQFQQQGLLDERGLTCFTTLHNMQTTACTVFAPKRLFATWQEPTQQFQWMSYQQFADQVHSCRAVLHHLGIGAFDKIGIISNNRWEWAALACAAYSLNANLVPMYEAQLPADWTYIINDAGCKVVFAATQEIFDKIQSQVRPNTPLVQATLCLDAPAGQPHALATLMNDLAPDTDGKFIQAPVPDDLANLIYTSGTTGKPKGVELTHDNFVSNVKSAARSMVSDPRTFILPDDVSLAFLPWAHSYGQTCELWLGMAHGGGAAICRGVPQLIQDLPLVKPSVLFAVPTLYKRIYDGVHNMMETASPVRKRLMRQALALGQERAKALQGQRPPLGLLERWQFQVLDSLVLSKIRARFGGRLRHSFVAGAACPSEVLTFMDSIGITVCEGYGLTETSPIICINTPENRKVGCVGKPIGGVKVYIVDEDGQEVAQGEEGEICCVGPNVMRGYYKNPQATAEVLSDSPDGSSHRMFHTGDLGRMDADGYVRITGRIKEQYKLENGKYVVPTPIEEAIGMSRFISQVVLCGANRPYNVALLVPEWNAIRQELKVPASTGEEELTNDPRVKNLIDGEIALHCARIKKFEIPQQWSLVAPFTAANDMLTPKMSIRRHKVIQAYAQVISHMYGDDPVVAPAADSTGAKEAAVHAPASETRQAA